MKLATTLRSILRAVASGPLCMHGEETTALSLLGGSGAALGSRDSLDPPTTFQVRFNSLADMVEQLGSRMGKMEKTVTIKLPSGSVSGYSTEDLYKCCGVYRSKDGNRGFCPGRAMGHHRFGSSYICENCYLAVAGDEYDGPIVLEDYVSPDSPFQCLEMCMP